MWPEAWRCVFNMLCKFFLLVSLDINQAGSSFIIPLMGMEGGHSVLLQTHLGTLCTLPFLPPNIMLCPILLSLSCTDGDILKMTLGPKQTETMPS